MIDVDLPFKFHMNAMYLPYDNDNLSQTIAQIPQHSSISLYVGHMNPYYLL